MVVDPNGPPCPCGKRGCWERFASGTGLGRLARDAASGGRLDAAVALAGGDPEAVRGEHVTASARAGDAESQAVLDSFARWIALGLANLVNVLDPSVIVIGGGLVEAADLLLPEVRARFAALVLAGEHRPIVPIVPAVLGERAGAIGAALLLRRRAARLARRDAEPGDALAVEHALAVPGHHLDELAPEGRADGHGLLSRDGDVADDVAGLHGRRTRERGVDAHRRAHDDPFGHVDRLAGFHGGHDARRAWRGGSQPVNTVARADDGSLTPPAVMVRGVRSAVGLRRGRGRPEAGGGDGAGWRPR